MRKAAFFLCILLLVPLLLVPGSSLSGQKLFVLDLKVAHGVKDSLAKALSIVIRDEIHNFGTHEVLSREDIDAVAERATIEQLLGCDNDQCLIDLGQQIGTEYLVAGALSKLGKKYYFSLRLLDTGGKDTGVKKRVNWICPCDEGELIDAARGLAGKLFGREVAVEAPGGGVLAEPPAPRTERLIMAKDFSRHINLEVGGYWGADLIHNGPPYTPRENLAEYDVTFDRPGEYELWVEYAAEESRPVDIYLNGELVKRGGIENVTGGWNPRHCRWYSQGGVSVRTGRNVLRLYRSSYFPHIRSIKFIPTK